MPFFPAFLATRAVKPTGIAVGRRVRGVSRRPRRAHRALRLDSTHWRRDGEPKVRFESRAEALGAAAERSAEADTTLGVYHCPYCRGWHMGSRSDEP